MKEQGKEKWAGHSKKDLDLVSGTGPRAAILCCLNYPISPEPFLKLEN
jgi:hypothetical protein